MKKRNTWFVLLLSLCMLLAACAPTASDTDVSEEAVASAPAQADEMLDIVCTTFPAYDWTREVLGEHGANLTMLSENGVDLHSFQPTAEDIRDIAESDVFIYVGGVSETWIEEVLEGIGEDGPLSVNLMESLGDDVLAETLLPGMQADGGHAAHAEDEAHDHAEDEAHDHAEDEAHDHAESEAHDHAEGEAHDHADEHIWLSLARAQILTEVIAAALGEVDTQNAADYAENSRNYINSLQELDGDYREMVEAAERNTLLFADRFPFFYLCEDYGLEPYAAFSGCSADTEASFETVASLSDTLAQLNLPYVLILDDSSDTLAQTLMENAGVSSTVLEMDSMQSVSSEEAESRSYLGVMQENLEVLRTTLN